MRRRVLFCSILVAICLAVVAIAIAPALAGAVVRPAAMAPDVYETDDTSATAKVLPPVSIHSFSNPGTDTADVDWSVISIADTGTPIFYEVSRHWGWSLPQASLFMSDDTTESGLIGLGGPPIIWGGYPGFAMSFLAKAPKPGLYYLQVTNAYPAFSGGGYELFEQTSLAKRLAGADRFGTAVAVSKRMWSSVDNVGLESEYNNIGVHTLVSPAGVILATGRGFADALAAGPWVAMGDPYEGHMPILLTERDILPAPTKAEILRLASARKDTNLPFTVYIVGGPSVVSPAVEAQLSALNVADPKFDEPISEIVRVAGANRFATATEIAAREASTSASTSSTVFIANGFSFPDALSAGPVAGAARAPLLLVGTDSIPAETAGYITSHPTITKAVVVGSSSVVSESVLAALSAPPFSLETTRVFGPDRYRTSEALARWGTAQYGMLPLADVLVTGANYPDGLAAAGLCAFSRTPLLLTSGTSLSSSVVSFTTDFPLFYPSFIVGGPAAVSASVETSFNNVWRTGP